MDMSNNYHLLWGETTIYSAVMGDVLLEQKFNYLLYGILHVQIG